MLTELALPRTPPMLHLSRWLTVGAICTVVIFPHQTFTESKRGKNTQSAKTEEEKDRKKSQTERAGICKSEIKGHGVSDGG